MGLSSALRRVILLMVMAMSAEGIALVVESATFLQVFASASRDTWGSAARRPLTTKFSFNSGGGETTGELVSKFTHYSTRCQGFPRLKRNILNILVKYHIIFGQ